MMKPNPHILATRILHGAAGGPHRQDGTRARQGELLVALRLGPIDTIVTLTPRGELLITSPDSARYSIIAGCLHYAECCPADGTPGTTTAQDFHPDDFTVGNDYL